MSERGEIKFINATPDVEKESSIAAELRRKGLLNENGTANLSELQPDGGGKRKKKKKKEPKEISPKEAVFLEEEKDPSLNYVHLNNEMDDAPDNIVFKESGFQKKLNRKIVTRGRGEETLKKTANEVQVSDEFKVGNIVKIQVKKGKGGRIIGFTPEGKVVQFPINEASKMKDGQEYIVKIFKDKPGREEGRGSFLAELVKENVKAQAEKPKSITEVEDLNKAFDENPEEYINLLRKSYRWNR